MNFDQAYDSDAIDEDVESALYAAVYFDQSSANLSEKVPNPPERVLFVTPSHTDPQSDFDANTAVPLSAIRQVTEDSFQSLTNSFSWDFLPKLDENARSLSLIADAIYLNLTGELPPSIKKSIASNGEKSISPATQKSSSENHGDIASAACGNESNNNQISIDISTRNNKSSSSLASRSSPDAFYLASSESDSDGNMSTKSSKLDTSDIVLGVTRPGDASDYLVNDIALLLRRSSSAPSNWRVDHDERKSQLSHNNRYYNLSNRVCSVCLKKGHTARDCSRLGPVCILCGRDGHLSKNCPAVYCCICLQPGHTSSSCSNKSRQLKSKCKICRQTGHSENICSETWRQYRGMTSGGEPSFTETSVRKKFCCNCGRRGHQFEDCRSRRFRHRYLIQRPLRQHERLSASKAGLVSRKVKIGPRGKKMSSRGSDDKHNSQKIESVRIRRRARSDEKSSVNPQLKTAHRRVEKKLFKMALGEVEKKWKKKDKVVYRNAHEIRSCLPTPSEASHEAEYLSFDATPPAHHIREEDLNSTRSSMHHEYYRPFRKTSSTASIFGQSSSLRAGHSRSTSSRIQKRGKSKTDLPRSWQRKCITSSDFHIKNDDQNFKIVQRCARSKGPRLVDEGTSSMKPNEKFQDKFIFHSTPSNSRQSLQNEFSHKPQSLQTEPVTNNRSFEDEEWYRKSVRQPKLSSWDRPRKRRCSSQYRQKSASFPSF